MKKSRIKKALKHKNKTWCMNKDYAPEIAACRNTRCKFKGDEERLGKAKELKECSSFWITETSKKFESGVTVLIAPTVDNAKMEERSERAEGKKARKKDRARPDTHLQAGE